MKPAPFDYTRPASVSEAAAALAAGEGGAKLIAGGQSLGPMLNLRLVQPRLLVDVAGIEALHAFEETADALRIGAGITAANIEDQRIDTGAVPLLQRVAAGIAYRAVRNRGTVGGSLCHADPAADWVNLMPALGARYELVGPRGRRTVAAADFMTAAFETVLAPDEVLATVVIPKPSPGARFGHVKIARKTGKFAMAIAVVVSDPGRGVFRALIGATHGRPLVIEDAASLLGSDGNTPDTARIAALLAEAGITEPAARQLHLTALRRAAAEAFSKALPS
ncbi:FAD binding domain-containing protein [Ancylobacter mangrovi]|uniref:FAD binding domain-containing protein n=1 Tax=Ancylobacter mangrovi TaxID=2972472 RepID=UPI00216123BD|nr:FAD binding domain-containing protein [Ancylobacter mangrovi]MCS0503677.1 FAD binding domain-containing protein [Ancylobacter mangrovi]